MTQSPVAFFSVFGGCRWVIYVTAIACTGLLLPAQSGGSLNVGNEPLIERPIPHNTSELSLNSSSDVSSKLKIACNKERYGKNLKVASCRQIFGFLRHDDTKLAYAQRDSGVPHSVPLPLRTYSSELPYHSNLTQEALLFLTIKTR